MPTTPTLDRARLATLMAREEQAFIDAHPRSGALFERAKASLLDGVPMNWMIKWPGAYPPYVDSASGAHFTCVDGHDYVDLCLGDTGAMAGHGAAATIAAVSRQMPRGITHMLPTEDAAWVGEELRRRFGLQFWQFTITATDANRFSLRLARHITGRPLVAVHDFNYHGSVDETFAWLTDDGRVESRRGNIGPQIDPALTTRVVPFNDIPALEAALGGPPGGGAAHRAGAHQRRHRAARTRLSRGRSARSPAGPARSSSSTRPTRSVPVRAG